MKKLIITVSLLSLIFSCTAQETQIGELVSSLILDIEGSMPKIAVPVERNLALQLENQFINIKLAPGISSELYWRQIDETLKKNPKMDKWSFWVYSKQVFSYHKFPTDEKLKSIKNLTAAGIPSRSAMRSEKAAYLHYRVYNIFEDGIFETVYLDDDNDDYPEFYLYSAEHYFTD